MDKKEVYSFALKKAKEYFKKKRKKWKVELGEINNMSESYEFAQALLNYLFNSFNDDEKEKYNFNRLSVGILINCMTENKDTYIIQLSYN